MLTSIRQVDEQFFRKFFGLCVPVGDKEKTILCRYAKKSSSDYTEEQEQQIYPCIAIQDYVPIPKDEWYIDMHTYFGGKSLDGLRGYLFFRPIWMNFKYDVSIVSKSYNEYMALQDYFMQNFVYGKRFIFNQYFSGEEAIGDIVPYEVRATDIPRVDGVFETNYEFTCSVWLYPRKPEEVDVIQRIVITLDRNDRVLYKAGRAGAEEVTKKVRLTSDMEVSETPAEGHALIVYYINTTDHDCTITFSGGYKAPDGGVPSFTIPTGGYAKVSYTNTSDIVFIRGVLVANDEKREIILSKIGPDWILEEGEWNDWESWQDDDYWKDSPDD